MRSSIGASVTLGQLESDPHSVLAGLRRREPVSWIPALDGWLVTSYELAVAVMRDPRRFTVDDPRFSTARVLGPSMLSSDGAEHLRHRGPFLAPFRPREMRARLAELIAAESRRLLDRLKPAGGAELRTEFAGPLAAAVIANVLGLGAGAADEVLACYDAIAGAVSEITSGAGAGSSGTRAFGRLRERLRATIDADDEGSLLAAVAASSDLNIDELTSNAGVLLFGGIETTEGMIANALLLLLGQTDAELERIRAQPRLLDAAIEETLRLEPAAAVVDRYATQDAELGGAAIAAGDLVRVSIAAANRDPDVFEDPDRFDPGRRRGKRQLAFAQGPHICLGVHLARLEAGIAVRHVLTRLPELRLDPAEPSQVRGLVFRKPVALGVLWSA